jgi:hypothetical protein
MATERKEPYGTRTPPEYLGYRAWQMGRLDTPGPINPRAAQHYFTTCRASTVAPRDRPGCVRESPGAGLPHPTDSKKRQAVTTRLDVLNLFLRQVGQESEVGRRYNIGTNPPAFSRSYATKRIEDYCANKAWKCKSRGIIIPCN